MLRRIFLPILAAAALFAQAPAPLVSPDVHNDGTVTFRLRAPNAKEVALNIQSLERKPLQKDEKGVWTVTTPKLTPDVYPYSFVVDGLNVQDPSNPDGKRSARSAGQSLVEVHGATPSPWDHRDVPHGLIHHHVYKSPNVEGETDYYVYTPPGWDPAGKETYPVLFLLHGMGDEAASWVTAGRSNFILDNLIADKKAKPMIVVTPYGYGFTPDKLSGPPVMRSEDSRVRLTKVIIDEMIPQVEKTYRAAKDRNQRAVGGLSMGGAQTLFIGLNHPEVFAYVAGMSSALPEFTVGTIASGRGEPSDVTNDTYAQTFPKLDAKINSQLRGFWVACGTDDALIKVNREFKAWLKNKDIKVTSIEIPGAHTWMTWHRNLAEIAPQLFQSK